MLTTQSGISFRRDIQGLRAVAVALVVLAHAGAAGFAGGFVGVDVFFVLSGYLITGLLVGERLATGHIRYFEFLARRLRRLLPAMLIMLLTVLVVASVFLTAFEMRMQARSFPFAAAWISNFFFAFAQRDYFQALRDDDLFLHTWSLGVEEQFYLLWPWLVLALTGTRIAADSLSDTGKFMLKAMGVIGAVSLIACVLMSSMNSTLAFYMMPARIWQFALGGMVFVGLHLAVDEHTERAERWALPAGLTGLLLVIASAALLGDDISYPGWYALAPSLGAALLIAAGTVARGNAVSTLLGRRPLVWVGDRSYSIYLWHWPILVLANALGLTRSVTGVVLAIAVSFSFVDPVDHCPSHSSEVLPLAQTLSKSKMHAWTKPGSSTTSMVKSEPVRPWTEGRAIIASFLSKTNIFIGSSSVILTSSPLLLNSEMCCRSHG